MFNAKGHMIKEVNVKLDQTFVQVPKWTKMCTSLISSSSQGYYGSYSLLLNKFARLFRVVK